MFGFIDAIKAKLYRDASKRPESTVGRVGGTVSPGAAYEPARRYQTHADRILAMRAALVCPPVYVALGMWRDLMRIPTVRIESARVGGAEPSANALAYAEHIRRSLGVDCVSPIGTRWSVLWGELIGAIEYGFGVWEMVPREVDGVWYTPLSYRDPASIAWWLVGPDEELAGCVQMPVSGWHGNGAEIPARQMLHLAWRPVSRSDFSGIGILRPAATLAEDHKLASQLRIVGVQRFAVGTPTAEISVEDARQLGEKAKADADDLETALSEYVSSDRAYLIPPPGWKVDIKAADYDVSRLDAVIGSIAREIYELVSMQHMLLGSADGSGSYAVGQVQENASRQSGQSACDWIADELSDSYIPRALEWQFGPGIDRAEMPRIRIDGLSSQAFADPAFLATLPALAAARFLTPDRGIEAAIRAAKELPEMEAATAAPRILRAPAAPAMPDPPPTRIGNAG